MKDNRESEQNRSSLFTVRDAENAMITFTIFAIAVIIGIFLHELVLKRNGIVNFLYAVADNVSKILSAATLLTIFEEGISVMFFRRAREEYAKLKKERAEIKEERRELEELKEELDKATIDAEKSNENHQRANEKFVQAVSDAGKTGTSKAGNQPPKQSEKPENAKPNK